MSLESFIQSVLVGIFRNVPAAVKLLDQERSLSALKEVICYNQSKIADFHFIAGRKHKALKQKLESVKNCGSQQIPDSLLEELKILYEDLEQYVDNDFRAICAKNFVFFEQFFERRVASTKKKPRFCIKGVQNGEVINLARTEVSRSIEDDRYPVRANTAFEEISDNGKYYFCSNIPYSLQRASYVNARINLREFPEYHVSYFRELLYRKKPDKNWQRCWNQIQAPIGWQKPPIETCYKSTLVIPLALNQRNGWVSDEFCRRFEIRDLKCFGFLCMDHQNVNFFNEKEDVSLGYIFADLISLYLLQRLNCTDYSSIFKESEKYCRGSTQANP
jgi:hypothetical protein